MEGAGKTGCPHAPVGLRAKSCAKARSHRYRRKHSGLPCAVVYGLYVISSVNLADCHRRRSRSLSASPRLERQPLGRQDHTISPSASVLLVGQHLHVHRIPASRVVTTAIRPSEKRGGIGRPYVKSEILKTGIFLRGRLDSCLHAAPDRANQRLRIAVLAPNCRLVGMDRK
jgi:hypothetical protein